MPEFTGQNDLRSYLRVFWRWKLLLLAFLIAAPLVAYLLVRGERPMYRSSALVGVNQTTVSSSGSGGGSFSTDNVTAIAQLVTTTPVASVAADLLHPPAKAGQIVSEVSASGDTTTNFLTISAEDRSPQRAAAIANAFAHAISINLKQSAIADIDSSIASIKAQLSNMGPTNPSRPSLVQQLSQLRASRATQGSSAAILQAATPSATPSGPHIRRTVELGLLIGLLLGLGAIALAENADRRLRTPEDLERVTKLPMLAAVAPSAFADRLDTSVEDEEAFHMLRTSLMYFNVDRRLKSVVITSAGEKEGKTTVATRLALAAARAGQDVILMDADLRRAQVSSRLGLDGSKGLGAVLAGQTTMAATLVEFPIDEPGAGALTILPAGPPPPNPAALVGSEEMQRVLQELESRSDLVVIDTPAALAVSDPMALMRSVSGVVLVARMNRSSRQTVRRLQRIIESAHGTLLGAVATGATAGPGYEHYYPKYYAQNGANGSGAGGFFRRRRSQSGAVRGPASNGASPSAVEADSSVVEADSSVVTERSAGEAEQDAN
jgi:capsular exopolysaccharide synthesis family protein